MNDLVSIITPVYNSEKFLSYNIGTVQAQTYKNWEHILVDDCSTDGSQEVIKSFQEKDSRIRYFRLQKNGGAAVARNKAIELANGNYIAFLDSDDLWYPEKLEKQLHFMRQNNYYFTFSDYAVLIENKEKADIFIHCLDKVTLKRALYNNPIGCLTVIYDVGFFGKQYFPTIGKCEDHALWLNLLRKTNGYGLTECLSSYIKRNDSVSANKLDLIQYQWQVFRKVAQLSIVLSFFYSITTIIIKLKQIIAIFILMNFKVSRIGNVSRQFK
ncbi:glycosyltransferase family 2 protein [Maribacter algicola]|uniref:Glycosyltransferase family 2 protein n=1 Tax=Maribacter algicola TaxID=2498892 RepID=A0A426RLX3_9FLAO|nr:glycosyltransferase family 2 protein [Maribacter algicola]RRQ50016.1 glycosyltransferase family 2 protein [Maribacter algicola]